MSKSIRGLLFVLVALGAWSKAISPVAAATTEAVTSAASEPLLVDRWGVEHLWSKDLNTLPGGEARAFVLVFLDVNCPIVTRQGPTLGLLYDRFVSHDVQFLGIYSNDGITRMAMAGHKQKLDLPFPVFLDIGGHLARKYKARCTPEAFLLDDNLNVRYRGMIDDSGWKKSPGAVPKTYLADAVAGLLDGKIFTAETRAQGCELQLAPLVKKLPAKQFTWHDDVAPIVYRRCVTCHYPGGIGPFALDTLESVQAEANTIRREVDYQRMPPWHADMKRGQAIEEIKALANEERQTLLDWIDQGQVRREQGERDWLLAGVPPTVPLALPKVAGPGEFTIGDGHPDLIARMPMPFTVKASTVVEYQYFWVPNDSNVDRYIQAIECLPGNRRVVHHMQACLISKDQRPADISKALSGAMMMAKVNGYGGKDCWRIASYTPGDHYSARTYGPDEAMFFPAGFDLVFEIHYSSTDEDEVDRSSIGIVWRKEPGPPAKLIRDQLFVRPRNVEVAADNPHVKTEFFPYFKQNVLLIDARPHMHLRGGDSELYAVYPDGREELLLAVPAFDFNWQRRYVFREPVRLPAGSTLRFVGHWDNSRLNPHNPDSGKVVYFGEESFDEMSNLGATFRIDEEAEQGSLRKLTSPIAK